MANARYVWSPSNNYPYITPFSINNLGLNYTYPTQIKSRDGFNRPGKLLELLPQELPYPVLDETLYGLQPLWSKIIPAVLLKPETN